MPIHLPTPTAAKHQRDRILQHANIGAGTLEHLAATAGKPHRADHSIRRRDRIRARAHSLNDDTITRLLNRARYAAVDAYSGGTAAGSNDVSRPTEAAAVRDAGGRVGPDGEERADTWDTTPADPVRDGIADLFALLAEADALLRIFDQRRPRIDTHPNDWAPPAELLTLLAEADGVITILDRKREYLTHDHERAAGRQSSLAGDCACCDRPVSGAPGDKLVAGYCKHCYNAWHYAGRDDRVQFQRDHALRHPETHGGERGDATPDDGSWDPARHVGAHQLEDAARSTGGS